MATAMDAHPRDEAHGGSLLDGRWNEATTVRRAAAALITTCHRSGPATLISMSGTLDGPAAAMAAIYLLEQADVADGDFTIDLRAADLVDDGHLALVTALRRRLAVRRHQLHVARWGNDREAGEDVHHAHGGQDSLVDRTATGPMA
jgi:hypothetical protein